MQPALYNYTCGMTDNGKDEQELHDALVSMIRDDVVNARDYGHVVAMLLGFSSRTLRDVADLLFIENAAGLSRGNLVRAIATEGRL